MVLHMYFVIFFLPQLLKCTIFTDEYIYSAFGHIEGVLRKRNEDTVVVKRTIYVAKIPTGTGKKCFCVYIV